MQPSIRQRPRSDGEVGNLQQCRLLHDRRAWGLDTDSDEWRTWEPLASLPGGLLVHMGFDRADLAILAATHHAGVAMGAQAAGKARRWRAERW